MTVTTNNATIVKVEDTARRVGRTVVQVVLALGIALGVFQVVAPQILAAIANVLPGPWVVWLTGAIATVGVFAAALSRVMAIPAVNALIGKLSAPTVIKTNGSSGLVDTATPAEPIVAPDTSAVIPSLGTADASASVASTTTPSTPTVAEPVIAQPVDTANVELSATGVANPETPAS